MSRKFFFFLFIMISNVLNADDLWQKAEQIASENWNLVPGRIHKEKKVFKKNGNLKSFKELVLHSSLTGDSISVQLIQARTDKKELTESSSYVQDEMSRNYLPQNESIFHNSENFVVSVQATRISEIIHGRKCSIYLIEFTTIEDDKFLEYKGRLWLDAENGTPYKLEKSCKKLPSMMKSFLETTEFVIDDNGRWITKSETTLTEVSVLLMKLKMELKYTYSDYWIYPIANIKNE